MLSVARNPALRRLATRPSTTSSGKEDSDWQVDGSFWQGAAFIGGIAAYAYGTSHETQVEHAKGLVKQMRNLGLSDVITERQLLVDFVQNSFVAGVNVLFASPLFYFLFNKIHNVSWSVSAVRSITGTVRIAPMILLQYVALLGLGVPFLTARQMQGGMDFKEAKSTATTSATLGGLIAIEALVELRGCGVPWAAMSVGTFVIFLPALVGRLATGVLTQYEKTGSGEKPSLLPASWATGEEWQRQASTLFRKLAIDKDFLTTVVGTTVFQHVLNGVTRTLQTKGSKTVFKDVGKYLAGGITGTPLGSLQLIGRTFLMRLFFCAGWNWFSAQPRSFPAFEAAAQSFEAGKTN